MAFDLFNLGKQALNKVLPQEIKNAAGILDRFGIDTGFGTRLPVEDPLRSYMWEVSFRDQSGRGEYITHYAKTTAIPASISENIKRWYAGVEYSYSGRDTSPRVFRVTFWDNQNLTSYRYFQYWYDIMNQGTENKKALPINYTRNIQLTLKDSSDAQELFTFDIIEAYPIEISEVSLSYAESTEYTFDVMFSFRRKVMR